MQTLKDLYDEDKSLRPYQVESKKKVYEGWDTYDSIMLQLPTGTGKTRVFTSIIKDIQKISAYKKKRIGVLVLAHRTELIEQIHESLGLKYGIGHGIIKAGFEQCDWYPVQVASVQTINRRLEFWSKKGFDYIIIDEAHHTLAKTYLKVCKSFPHAKILGVTATPCRLGGEGLRKVFQDLIISQPVSKFIEQGYLSQYQFYSIPSYSHLLEELDSIDDFAIDGDYSERAMMRVCDKRKVLAGLVEAYQTYAEGKKGIIYSINQEHNRHICEEFTQIGVNIKAIDSKTPSEERKKVVSDFKNGKIDIICNVNIFSEGFDCPDIEFIMLARPTCSLAMYLQQVGRGLRPHPKKSEAIILDNVGSYTRFGLPSAKRQWKRHFEGYGHLEQSSKKTDKPKGKRKVNLEEGEESLVLIYNGQETESKEENTNSLVEAMKYSREQFPLGAIKILQKSDCRSAAAAYLMGTPYSDADDWINDLENDFYMYEETAPDYYDCMLRYKYKYEGKYGLYRWTKGYISDKDLDEISDADFMSSIESLLEPIYSEIGVPDGDDNAIVLKNGRYGIIDGLFNERVHFEYDQLEFIRPQTYLARKWNKYGVVSPIYTIVPIEYDCIHCAGNEYTTYLGLKKGEQIELLEYDLSIKEYKAIHYPQKKCFQLPSGQWICNIKDFVLAFCDENGILTSPFLFQSLIYVGKSDVFCIIAERNYNRKGLVINNKLEIINKITLDEFCDIEFNEADYYDIKRLKELIHNLKRERKSEKLALKQQKKAEQKSRQETEPVVGEEGSIDNKKEEQADVNKNTQTSIDKNEIIELFRHHAIIKMNGLFGIAAKSKRRLKDIVVPCIYDSIKHISGPCCVLEKETKYGLYNAEKRIFLADVKYDSFKLIKKDVVKLSLDGEDYSYALPGGQIGRVLSGDVYLTQDIKAARLYRRNQEILEAEEIIPLTDNLVKYKLRSGKWRVFRIGTANYLDKRLVTDDYDDITLSPDETYLVLHREGKRDRIRKIETILDTEDDDKTANS